MTGRHDWLATAVVLPLLVLSGCSDDVSDARRTFVAQCYPGLRDKGLCECMFEELRHDHMPFEIADAATSQEQPSAEWKRDMAKVTLTCLKKQ